MEKKPDKKRPLRERFQKAARKAVIVPLAAASLLAGLPARADAPQTAPLSYTQ